MNVQGRCRTVFRAGCNVCLFSCTDCLLSTCAVCVLYYPVCCAVLWCGVVWHLPMLQVRAFLKAPAKSMKGLPRRPVVGTAISIRLDLDRAQISEWFGQGYD